MLQGCASTAYKQKGGPDCGTVWYGMVRYGLLPYKDGPVKSTVQIDQFGGTVLFPIGPTHDPQIANPHPPFPLKTLLL